jgi:uridine kinase
MTKPKKSSFVVGISSPAGGGKTTVAHKVAELLAEAVVISFDDYDETSLHPADYRSWLAAGADYNAWHTPRLAGDLERLKQGQEIVSPVDGRTVWK